MNVKTDFSDHDVWRLLLTVGMRGLEAVFYNRNTHEFVPYLQRNWECSEADVVKNIEDTIYDDPLLPDGYDASILLRPKATIIVPKELCDPEDTSSLQAALEVVDAAEQKDVWYDPLQNEAALIFSTPRGLQGFLSRTYLTEDIHHVLTPMVNKCRKTALSEPGEKMWVHISDNVIDVAAFRDGKLIHAGSWYCTAEADIVYHILFAWHALKFDATQGELRISGTEELRRQVLSLLRKHINYVSLCVTSQAVNKAVNDGVSFSVANLESIS
ncbi:MAG: DUF3822 family protein [Muribaculaceae bacterium]|nr:DUF3822 family protein [Muribaculaceae bacterium]